MYSKKRKAGERNPFAYERLPEYKPIAPLIILLIAVAVLLVGGALELNHYKANHAVTEQVE